MEQIDTLLRSKDSVSLIKCQKIHLRNRGCRLPVDDGMKNFIKLNSFQEDHGIFVRASAIAIIHQDNEGMTKIFVEGLPQAMTVMQSPDEVLAMLKDDSASLPVRHVMEKQVEGASGSISATASKKSAREHLQDVKSRYRKTG